MARKQWRCFFCDEVFKRHKDAAEHFGSDEGCETDTPACKIARHEGHLITYIRKLENELRQLMHADPDDTPVDRAYMALEAEVTSKVREAEERGYARGVADMKAQGHCPEPSRHAA